MIGGGQGAQVTTAIQTTRAWHSNRWNQLLLGVIAMMAISSPQYVWTLFTGPLNQIALAAEPRFDVVERGE